MSQQFTLSPITAKTQGEINTLRKGGFVPVSLQHKGSTTLHYQQETRPLAEYVQKYGTSAIVDLLIEPATQTQKAMIQTIQRDALTQKILQVSFQQIRLDDRITTHVRINFTGEPAEIRTRDAMVQHSLSTLEIECAQDKLPSHITVSLANMQVGDVIHVSDIAVDPGFRILTSQTAVLATLTVKRTSVEAPVAEAAA